MIRTVLADDEVLGRQKLRELLKGINDVEIVGESASASETIELVNLVAPDLLFLDIHMPDMDGFDVVDALGSDSNGKRPQIIFVTANDRYAVRAFEIHAIDYLLKPFTVERLRTAVERASERMSVRSVPEGSNGRTTQERYTTRIVFKSRGRILFLPVEEIRFISAEENYVRICTGSESHLLREAIGRLESRLDPLTFLRVHRSFIVNLHYVKEVRNEADGDATVILVSGEEVAMSRTYRSKIQKLIRN